MISEPKYNKDSFSKYIDVWRANVTQEIINRFFIRFTYHSIKMVNKELILNDVESIFKGEHINAFKSGMIVFYEIQNYKEIYEKFFRLSEISNTELSIDLIKNLHYILIKDFAMNDEKQGVSEMYEENDLILLIEAICNQDTEDINIYNAVSYFYCWFLKYGYLHGYNNENVVRILINYLLMKKGFPPIIFFKNDIEEYKSSLLYFYETKDVSKMADFLEKEAHKTWVRSHYLRLKSLNEFL